MTARPDTGRSAIETRRAALVHASAVIPFLAGLGLLALAGGLPEYGPVVGRPDIVAQVRAMLFGVFLYALFMASPPLLLWLGWRRRHGAVAREGPLAVDFNLTVVALLGTVWLVEVLWGGEGIRPVTRWIEALLTWGWLAGALTVAGAVLGGSRLRYPRYVAWPILRSRAQSRSAT